MAKLPEPMHGTASMIYSAYESDAADGNRPHLGASLIGHPCERYLWLTFRWALKKKFHGRMLRLFETGQLEEPRVARNLRRIGVELYTEAPDGKQWRISDFGGHFAGSMDGAGRGFPEAPKAWAVWECKTSNTKGFKELQDKGLQKAKPQHYAQVTCYMGYTGMDRAMYTCVCKETDEIYVEWVHFDSTEFAKLKARAERIIKAAEPPLRVSKDPSWHVCKMCDYHSICHGDEAPDVNCRTCAHSTPVTDGDEGKWTCREFGEIGLLVQRESHLCQAHRYIPIMLERFGQQKDYVNGDVVYQSEHGDFANGQEPGALSSLEIKATENKAALADAARIKGELHAQGITTAKVVA